MEQQSDVPEVQRSEHELRPVCTLTRINPGEWSKDRLWWLWTKLATQDYAFDDSAKATAQQTFLVQLFAPGNEFYEIGDAGIAGMLGIQPKVNAFFHFAVWEDVGLEILLPLQKELFTDVFTRHELMHITGMIPSFNKLAIRAAQIAGFRYEGEIRKSFFKHGVYHNLQIYGILRDEFFRREVNH